MHNIKPRWFTDHSMETVISPSGHPPEQARHEAGPLSEVSQDSIALDIIHRAGADPEIWDGRLEADFVLLQHKWSSLPGGSQQDITAEQAGAFFFKRLHEMPP